MPVILLIRHGENEYVKKGRLAGRLPGVHLNARGQEQAALLAERLGGAPIRAIYSSPLERTQETAAPLARALGLEVASCPGLIEVDFGEWQDQKIKGLSRTKPWKIVQGAPSAFRFPGGETFAEAQLRIVGELRRLAEQHEAQALIACVSHSDPIKLAIAYFIGLPLDMFQRLSVSPGSVSALALGEMGGRLLSLNYEFSFTLSKP
ncbi:MAG: histidine phosphatase family protein [Chloroflexota bacterium]